MSDRDLAAGSRRLAIRHAGSWGPVPAGLLMVTFPSQTKAQTFCSPLDSLDGLQACSLTAEPATYRSKKTIRVTETGRISEDTPVIRKDADPWQIP
ncbi:MAG: hypothetical protein HXY20_05525 [Acidobacteria bacterium]|nr:hypothetical protein [Acidobacteriota bacterium]